MPNSSSWFLSTFDGELSISDIADVVLGNAITSRIWAEPTRSTWGVQWSLEYVCCRCSKFLWGGNKGTEIEEGLLMSEARQT